MAGGREEDSGGAKVYIQHSIVGIVAVVGWPLM